MPVHYTYRSDSNILESRAVGRITAEENAKSNARVHKEMERRPGLKLLVDMREAELPDDPAVIIYMMDGFYALVGDALPVAVITRRIPDQTKAMLVETRAFIAGARIQLFASPEEARDWLEGL